MPNERPSYETIRIDLLPGAERHPSEGAPVSTRLAPRPHWSRPSRLMDSVVRSRYQELLQSIYDAALITDLSGIIVDANARAEEFFLLDRDQLLNGSIIRLLVGAEESLMESLNENLKNERYTLIQAYCQRSDGTSFPAEVAVNKLRLDQLRLCFFVRDTTRRTQAEELLRKENTALHNAGSGIAICDLEMAIEYANPAFADMIGQPDREALAGRPLSEFLYDPAVAEEMKAHVFERETPWVRETPLRQLSGESVFAQVSATSCRDADGEPVGVVFSFADITRHRQTEEALRRAQDELAKRDDERILELSAANERLLADLAAKQVENETLRKECARLAGFAESPSNGC